MCFLCKPGMDPIMFGCYSKICIKFKYDQNCQDPGLALSIPLTELPPARPPPRDAEVIFSPNYARALLRRRSTNRSSLPKCSLQSFQIFIVNSVSPNLRPFTSWVDGYGG